MMSEHESTDSFPMDWNEWRAMWRAWLIDHGHLFHRSSYRWPARNFMADEVLLHDRLTYRNGSGRNVELSEVTFLGTRSIGITFGTAAGTDVPDQSIVYNFAQLAEVLELADAI